MDQPIARLSLGSGLLGSLSSDLLGALVQLGLGLEAHVSSTPLSLDILVKLCVEVLRQSLQLALILLVDLGQGNNGGILLVSQQTKSALSLHNSIGDIHLAAQGGQPDNQLQRINIVGNQNQLGLLLLDQGGDVLQSVFKSGRGSSGILLATSGSSSLKSGSLGLLGLRLVLHQQLEHFRSLVLVKSLGELVNSRRDLQAL